MAAPPKPLLDEVKKGAELAKVDAPADHSMAQAKLHKEIEGAPKQLKKVDAPVDHSIAAAKLQKEIEGGKDLNKVSGPVDNALAQAMLQKEIAAAHQLNKAQPPVDAAVVQAKTLYAIQKGSVDLKHVEAPARELPDSIKEAYKQEKQ